MHILTNQMCLLHIKVDINIIHSIDIAVISIMYSYSAFKKINKLVKKDKFGKLNNNIKQLYERCYDKEKCSDFYFALGQS